MRDEVADVLIVGAGPSGGMAARHLTAAGFSVVCLEQGRWHSSAEFHGDRPIGEVADRQRWHWSPNIRQIEADYPLDESNSDVALTMFNGVGGSTVLWGSNWHRLLPSDFAVKSLDGVADDWPLSYFDLVPHYEDAEFVRWLHSSDTEGFAALALAVAGGYYTRPNVRQALGYSGPARAPVDLSQAPDFLAQSLLQPVIGRGEIWRRP